MYQQVHVWTLMDGIWLKKASNSVSKGWRSWNESDACTDIHINTQKATLSDSFNFNTYKTV